MNKFYQACKYTEVYSFNIFVSFYLQKEKQAYGFKPNVKK